MHTDPKDTQAGLYHKFDVTRTDGRSAPGEKHEGCRYLVIDLDHDPDAPAMARAYAALVSARGYDALAADLNAYAAPSLQETTQAVPALPYVDFNQRRPEHGQVVYLACKRPSWQAWTFVVAELVDEGEGWYFVLADQPDQWVVEDDLDEVLWYWMPTAEPGALSPSTFQEGAGWCYDMSLAPCEKGQEVLILTDMRDRYVAEWDEEVAKWAVWVKGEVHHFGRVVAWAPLLPVPQGKSEVEG